MPCASESYRAAECDFGWDVVSQQQKQEEADIIADQAAQHFGLKRADIQRLFKAGWVVWSGPERLELRIYKGPNTVDYYNAYRFEGKPTGSWEGTGRVQLSHDLMPDYASGGYVGKFELGNVGEKVECIIPASQFVNKPVVKPITVKINLDASQPLSEIEKMKKAIDALPHGIPTDAKVRKSIPVYSGVFKYFPRALLAVAELSRIGNDQHNPGEPLHWAREKSGDELDALGRHLLQAGTIDTDGVRHSTKVAWRALANLEKELEA